MLLSLYDLELFGEETAAKLRRGPHFRRFFGGETPGGGDDDDNDDAEGEEEEVVVSLAHRLHEEVRNGRMTWIEACIEGRRRRCLSTFPISVR